MYVGTQDDGYAQAGPADEDAQCYDCIWFEFAHTDSHCIGDYCHRRKEFVNRLDTCRQYVLWDYESPKPYEGE